MSSQKWSLLHLIPEEPVRQHVFVQDRQTMAAVGRLSYNELISALVFLTGQDASLAQTPSGTSLQSRTNSLHQQANSPQMRTHLFMPEVSQQGSLAGIYLQGVILAFP